MGTKPRGDPRRPTTTAIAPATTRGRLTHEGATVTATSATAATVTATTATTRATATATTIGRSFRQGFAVGYEQGYNGSGRYGNGRATPRRDPGYGNQYPTYPNAGRGGYGGYGGYGGGYYSEAYDRGLREGDQKGREDAKDGDRYDPRRHKWYRDGDRGYNSRYGSREQYKAAYRDAFERGYAQGYREYGYGRRQQQRRVAVAVVS